MNRNGERAHMNAVERRMTNHIGTFAVLSLSYRVLLACSRFRVRVNSIRSDSLRSSRFFPRCGLDRSASLTFSDRTSPTTPSPPPIVSLSSLTAQAAAAIEKESPPLLPEDGRSASTVALGVATVVALEILSSPLPPLLLLAVGFCTGTV